MRIMELLLYPDPRLLKPSVPLKPAEFNEELVATAKVMSEKCEKWQGHALAAPQVGIHKRFFVLKSHPDLVACIGANDQLPTFIANPEVTSATGTFHFKESCLSMPGVRASLVRPAMIGLRYVDIIGMSHAMICGGILGRVILHEMDHLDGRMFTEHLDLFTKSKVIGAINKLRRKATHRNDMTLK